LFCGQIFTFVKLKWSSTDFAEIVQVFCEYGPFGPRRPKQ